MNREGRWLWCFIFTTELLNSSKRLSGSILPSSRSTLKPSNHMGVHSILNIFKDNIVLLGNLAAAAAAKSLQSCLTLCDPIDGSPPGSPVPGILQARTLEWAAIAFSNAWKWKVKVKSLSHVLLVVTPLTAAHQAPPSMGFSRQEDWSGVPLPSPLVTLDNDYWYFIIKKPLPM